MHIAAVLVLTVVGVTLALVTWANPSSSNGGSAAQASTIESVPFRDDADDVPAFEATDEVQAASCVSLSHAAWYAFAPEVDTPLTAWVVPSQAGSDPTDVALVVWQVSADEDLVEVGCIDQRGTGGTEQLVFAASGEGTYYLQAGAVEGPADGAVALTVLADVQRPEHDLFGFARRIGTTPYRDEDVDAISARREPGETVPSCVDLQATTWYSVSAAVESVLSATILPARRVDDVLDPAMALYAGDAIDSLVEVACVNAAGARRSEHLEAPITGGEAYWLQVGAVTSQGVGPGVYTLSVDGMQAIDLRPVPDVVLGDAPLDVVADANSGLPVTTEVSGPCRISDGALVAEGAGLCTITASQEGDSTWAPAQPVTTTLRVGRGRQTIDMDSIVDAAVGESHPISAMAESGLAVVFETSGGCRVTDGMLSADGSGTCTIVATQPGDDDWAPAEPVTMSVLVAPGAQQIELDLPSASRVGSDAVELMAVSESGLPVALGVQGPCELLEGGLVGSATGICTITATQDGDADWLAADPVTTTLRIGRGRQSIELAPLADSVFGGAAMAITTATDSGLPVDLMLEGPCELAREGLVSTGAGICIITATQEGDVDWAPARPVTTHLTIAPATQTIELAPIDGITVGGAAALSAASDSGLPVSWQASGPCLTEGRSLRGLGTGICTITATQDGDTDWLAAEPVTTALRIGRGRQSIELAPLADSVFGGAAVAITTATDSGLPVDLMLEGPCELAEEGLVSTGAGTCTITATQGGDVDWAPAEPVTDSLTIARATQTIELAPIDDVAFGDAPLELTAEAASALPVSWTANGPCELQGRSLRSTGAGTCIITATQDGDVDWAPAEPATTRLSIAPASQAIELASIDDVTVGGAVALSAASDSGLPLAWQASGPCLTEGSSLRALGTGTCTITATQDGDTDWLAAEPVTTALRIGRGRQSIQVEPPAAAVFGGAPVAITTAIDSGLPVDLALEGPCTLTKDGLVSTGAGTCTITASQGGDVDWAPAEPVITSLTIAPASQNVELTAIDDRLLGEGPIDLEASSGSGLPISYSAEGPCRVDDGRLELRDSGRCTITASQQGDTDWEPGAASTSFRIIGPITGEEQDMSGRIAISPPGTLVGDGARVTSEFEPGTLGSQYYAVALEQSDVLEIGGIEPGTAWSIAGPQVPSKEEIDWQEITSDPGTSEGRWVATDSGIHSIRVVDAGNDSEDSRAYTLRVKIDSNSRTEARQEAEAALLKRMQRFGCTALSADEDPRAFAAGAVAGIECEDPRRGVSELKLFAFPDAKRLRPYHRERVGEVRPGLASTAEACRLGQRGARDWTHGRVACWIPDGRQRSVLHWTDERTNTYGVLRTTVHQNRRADLIWRALHDHGA